MTQHFDAIVVGTQLSGVISAALLAKRGRRVALIDHDEHPEHYTRHGWQLPFVPTLLPVFESSPFMAQVHRELGLGPQLRTVTQSFRPSFQVVLSSRRIDVHDDVDALLRELELEFPNTSELFQQFFARLFVLDAQIEATLLQAPPLPPKGLRERLRAHAFLASRAHLDRPFEDHDMFASLPAPHPLRDFLWAPLLAFGYLWRDNPSTLHATRLIARYLRGTLTFSENGNGLLTTLLRAAKEAGVDMVQNAAVETVDVHKRRIKGVTLKDDKRTFSADYFISNTHTPFYDLLPEDKRHPKAMQEQHQVEPVGHLLTLNLLVKRDVIPAGMAQALFVFDGRQEGRHGEMRDAPIFVRRYRAQRQDDPLTSDSLHEVLCCAMPCQTALLIDSPTRLLSLKKQMVARMRRLVPFLEDFLVDASMPIEMSGLESQPREDFHLHPWHVHPYYETKRKPVLGVATRQVRTYFKNLVHCGRDVMPGLGLEGEYVTAKQAVDTMVKLAGRAWRT